MDRYVVALLPVAAAAGLRLVFDGLLGVPPHPSVVLFAGAAVAAGWYGGPWAGLLAIALGTAALVGGTLEPGSGLRIGRPDDQAALLAFFVTSLVGLWLTGIARGGGRRASRWMAPGFLGLAGFAAANLLAAALGQELKLIPGVSIVFWPPSGIFVAVLLLTHRRTWPWWVAAACAAELAGNVLWFHNPPHLALLYFSANAAEALTAALLVRRAVTGTRDTFSPRQLESPRNGLLFVLLAGMTAPAVGATIIATADAVLGKHDFWVAWPLVWLGDGTGLLLSAPLTLAAVHFWRHRDRLSIQSAVELAGTCGLTVLVTWLALRGRLPTVYLALPAIVWAAVRFQVLGAWLALAAVVLTVAGFTRSGLGEFAGAPEEMRQGLIALQVFLGVSASTALIVAGLSALNVRARERLRVANRSLERRVRLRTAALGESEALLRQTLHTAATGLTRCSRDLRFLSANPAYAKIAGLPVEQIVGRPMVDVMGEEAFAAIRPYVERVLRGERVEYEAEVALAGRDSRYVSVEYAPDEDAEGSIVGWVASVTDITERKQAEAQVAELNRSLERRIEELQTILDVSPVGISIAEDAECRRVWINPALRRLLHLPEGPEGPEGAEGVEASLSPSADGERPFRVLANGVEVPSHELPMQRSIATKQPVLGEELAVVLPDGTTYCLSQSSVPLFDEAGEVRGCIAFHIDVTERKRAEEELRTADRRKDEFLATLAHELRNPLAPLRNGLQVMKLAGRDAEVMERARGMMERQLEQMVRLVDDLMDVSRISRGKIELRKQPVPLATAVSSAVETSRPLLEQRGHELTVTLPEHPVVVEADLTRLAQVFMNLLINAAKYTDRGGHVWLTVEPRGSEVAVSVRDTGIGIAAHELPSIFEMFEQVDRSLEKEQGGLGIGLSLVKRLVEMHGGSIEARSEGAGRGAEFVVRLPVVAEAPVPPPPERHEPAVPKGAFRILIVDDNKDGADSLATMLTMMGHDVRTAYDGEEGVEQAERYRPDVALLDIGLPKRNGYEACRFLRRQPWGQEMVLIAVTGWGQHQDRRRSDEAGFDHHLVKPVDPQSLLQVLADLTAAKG